MSASIERTDAVDAAGGRNLSALAGRMRAGIVLNLVAAGFNQGSTFAVNLVVANMLGREAFGQYTMVIATIAMVATLGQLSMGYTATKHVAEFRSVDPERTSRILGLCAIVSIASALAAAGVLLAGGDLLAGRGLGTPELAPALRLSAAAVFFTIVNGYLTGALAGLESYPTLARIGVATGTIYTVACVALAWWYGLPGAVAGAGLSGLAQTTLLAGGLRRESSRQKVGIRFRGVWQERTLITTFALPASLTGVISMPAVWLGSAILARQGSGFQELALFGAANNFRTMVLFVPQAVNNVGMSLLNNQRRSSPEGYRRVFWLNALVTITAAIGVAAAVLIAGSRLLRWFGPSFAEGQTVLGILLAAAVIEALAIALYQIVVSQGRIWASLVAVSVPRDLGLVLAAAALTPAFGAVGLATAYTAGWGLALVGILYLVTREGLEHLPAAAVARR